MFYVDYKIKSKSNPEKTYDVRVYPTFEVCNCDGFKFRNYCNHVKEALKQHNLIKPKIYGKKN